MPKQKTWMLKLNVKTEDMNVQFECQSKDMTVQIECQNWRHKC